jgi:catechol 2,3-dioxygenase
MTKLDTAPGMVPTTNATPEGVLRPTLHHVNLKTTSDGLQALIDWYGIVVGAEVVFQYPFGAWLTNDRANHRIALLAFPEWRRDPEQHLHIGLGHTAFEYDSLEHLVASYVRLRDQGFEIFFAMDHGLTMSIYYLDPDGNGVELQVDNFGSWDASQEWMRGALEFRDNPLGVFFDPDLIERALTEGLSHQEIHERAFAGEYLPDPLPGIPVPEIAG